MYHPLKLNVDAVTAGHRKKPQVEEEWEDETTEDLTGLVQTS